MTIIQSAQKYLLGGYTSIPWSTNLGHKNDTKAFLFTLTNPHNIPPTKYPINSAKSKQCCSSFSCKWTHFWR
jgi:hypothetical protein